MKLYVDSTHDQTTIESDFSEDGSGDLFHSETAQDVEIDKILPSSPQANPSATQQKEKSHQENAVLLDKRDRLMKPLMENIKNASNGTSPKEVARSRTEGEIYSDERTLQKGDKHSNSMPNIQPPTVHNENGKRHVVIKYKRQPYPPEGRPLSASMGAFRFRKIQGVYGQLKKAQSSEDLRVDEGTVTKGSGDGTIKQNDDISSNYTKECFDTDIRNKTNQKSSSNPLAVNKPTTREIVTIPKKIMTKRKPAAPPLLRFTSYKVDDDMNTPSLFESRKRSTGVEGFTKDINVVGRTTEPIGQSYLEPHDYRHNPVDLRANTVSLSPGELAFAQKISPGERKNMPSSEMEKVEYPVIVSCNSKQQLPESNIPRVDSHSRDKTVKNSYSNTEIEPGLVYSENQREPVLHGSLSGSAASGSFLKNAMIERRVVLPSRYSVRSQKADPSSPTKPVQYGSTSDPRPRQQLENKLPLNKDMSSPMLLFSKRTYSPRVHPASKRMMIKRDTLPSSSLTERTVVTTSERPDDNNQGAHTRSDYTRQQSYPPISSSASASIAVDCEHDYLMLNNRETENESSNVRRTLETSDGREIVEECEHNFSPSQNIGDQNISSNNMSGSKTSSMFLDTAISERRSIFPSRLRSKAQNSTAGIGPPVLASQGNTTGLRYAPYGDESAILTENTGIKTDNPRINTGTKTMEVNMTTDSTQVKMVRDSAVRHDDSHFQQTSSDVNSVTSGTVHKGEPDNLTRENIQPTANKHVHRPIRAKNVVSSRPANQIQYGSSSDPRRRQQLEKARPGNTYSESKTKPFSKSTDYPRVRLASKRKMIGRRTLSTSKVTRGTGGEEIASDEISGNDLGVHSQTQQSDEVSGNDLRVHSQTQLSDEISGNDLRVHSQTKQSGQTGYPLINNTSPTATSDNGENEFLMPNDQDVGTEYSDNEMISEVHDAFEIMENNDQVLSQLNNVEDESVTTNNMSGSKTSSTFLNTAISERRSIFPSRLRSKAQISTAGIGPPVLASQGITTGLRFEQIISESNTPYELVSESAMEDGNPMPAESSGMEVDDALENTDLEGFEVNTATENTKVMINDGNEFHRDGTTPQQIKCVANSATLQTSHHEEANSPREGNVSLDESKGIQLPVPKPIEKLVPSQFPVNKHKLPTVSSPQRETIATPVKALPPSRIRTSTSSVADDSVDGRQTVKPIIRKPPMESIPSVPKKIKNFRFRQKMVLTGRLHHKSEENLKFFKQITKTTNDFYKEHARNT
ncbi:uncharacterized protein LOC117316758 [Pecten maximus]|uniref:uncharacterized protein LOC117316758 n=1 Tax=Pecten maximus TaxID=6579 RepID=UPI001458042E|nr:uncharacterized protein LOC117316758 [Pecten maximus]